MPFEKTNELSEKQAELLNHLIRHVEQHGYQPSMTEMGEALGGITAKAVRDRLHQLARKGFVELSQKHVDRSIRLRYVKFTAVFDEQFNQPPPSAAVEKHPVSGPVFRRALKEWLEATGNEWTTAPQLAKEFDTAVDIIYDALEHDDEGVFEMKLGEGRGKKPARLWRVKGFTPSTPSEKPKRR
jgi:hypothetical protein